MKQCIPFILLYLLHLKTLISCDYDRQTDKIKFANKSQYDKPFTIRMAYTCYYIDLTTSDLVYIKCQH